jgi:hypothetical protein
MSETCQSCSAEFTPKRAWQSYCSRRCSNRAAQQRLRAEKCADEQPAVPRSTECADTAPVRRRRTPGSTVEQGLRPYVWPTPPRGLGDAPQGPTPGALQGDDYPIEMDADGYPIMPECLRRGKAI